MLVKEINWNKNFQISGLEQIARLYLIIIARKYLSLQLNLKKKSSDVYQTCGDNKIFCALHQS